MLAVNIITCAWCVLLTTVSAADFPKEDRADPHVQDEENDVEYLNILYLYRPAWQELRTDFEQISDTLDLEMDHLKEADELSAHLNTAPEFKDRIFIKFLDELKSKTYCDVSMRVDLIVLRRILSRLPKTINSPFIRLIVEDFLIEGMRVCARDLETDKDVIEFIASPLLQDILGMREHVERILRRKCHGDKYCYKRKLNIKDFASVVHVINNHRLGNSPRINGIKLSFEFFKITLLCEKLDSLGIPRILGLLSEFRKKYGRGLGPNGQIIMYAINLRRQLRHREHLHILRQQENKGEYGHEPVCWKFFYLFGGYVYNREPCPTMSEEKCSTTNEIELGKDQIFI